MFVAWLRYTLADMNTTTKLFTCLLLCQLFQQAAVAIGPDDDDPELGGYVESKKWQEGAAVIPDYPDEDNLVKVEMERTNLPFTAYIDTSSLSVSQNDLVRYTILIKSNSGAVNVFYEGIRCSAIQYRTYAYGTSDGKMIKASNSEWQPIVGNSSMAHRYNLFHYYVCDKEHLPYKLNVIKNRIRYPEDFNTGDERSMW